MDPRERRRHQRFLRLFVAHEAAVHAFVRTLAARREDAVEIMQDVAVVLWEKFGEFDESRDFRAWACGVAKFETLAFYRDRARDRHVFDEKLLTTLADEGIADDATETRRAALETCLEKLPAEQRETVLAAYEPGASIDALAKRSGRTAMSLYKALHRVRVTLLACIERTLAAEGLR